jgi:hypothetical protein
MSKQSTFCFDNEEPGSGASSSSLGFRQVIGDSEMTMATGKEEARFDSSNQNSNIKEESFGKFAQPIAVSSE